MKVFLSLAFISILFIISVHAAIQSIHSFSENECMNCHIDYKKDPGSLKAPVTLLCKKCHEDITSTSSHPSDIYPVSTRIPPDLPLHNGMVTCNTCHNIHRERFLTSGEKTYFLRRTKLGRAFCVSCHMVKPEGHVETLVAAHPSKKYKVMDRSKTIDPISMECIGCHDGIQGSNVEHRLGPGIWSHESYSHPISVDYNVSRMKGKRLKPISMVDRRIRFFDGRIGCGTCHDLYSKLPKKLVMSNNRSKLCFECHDI
ncbi:MAG: cytochrome c3 family protein [Thermodesulfovibrionales bacterium]|jgi:predicted CXXCH cytochrome family protein|nr:cytochrome c3 family protein [Thermodesulfovibrionales bacterium]